MPISCALRQQSAVMNHLQKSLLPLLHDECGQDIVEYALVAALVALAAIAGISRVGSAASSVFTSVGSKITATV
jgi:pilus assembly protein Flp/PilA